MAESSHVTSFEAIEAFRANLIVYLSKARPAVEEVASEILRTRFWLENEQRTRWDHEIRIRRRELEEAQQELFTAKVSKLRDGTAVKEMAMRRALQRLREAEEKAAVTKRWARELENQAAPLVKQVEQLHSFLTSDMAKAVAYLGQVVKALEAYAGVTAPGGGGALPELPALEEPDATSAGKPDSSGSIERNVPEGGSQ